MLGIRRLRSVKNVVILIGIVSLIGLLSNRLTTSQLDINGYESDYPRIEVGENLLVPKNKLSKRRNGVSIAIGVPTVRRHNASYYEETLSYLINSLSAEEKNDCLIILFVAEPWNQTFVDHVIFTVERKFPFFLASGLLEVISPPASFYPDLSNLTLTLGDPQDRVKWRTKQNIDYAYLMTYASTKAVYYVQLEDDVIAKPGYITAIKDFTALQNSRDVMKEKGAWHILNFSRLGFIGKLFRSSDLPTLAGFFKLFANTLPVDWLIIKWMFINIPMCGLNLNATQCSSKMKHLSRSYDTALFGHIGVESSLEGKRQLWTEGSFGLKYQPTENLTITSSLWAFDAQHNLSAAYTGLGYFWAQYPNQGDFIDFIYKPPVVIERYDFKSGNPAHPRDIFTNTTVEILPATPIGIDHDMHIRHSDSAFMSVGHFDKNGVAKGTIPEAVGPISTLRLHVHRKSLFYVILSEIKIQEKGS